MFTIILQYWSRIVERLEFETSQNYEIPLTGNKLYSEEIEVF